MRDASLSTPFCIVLIFNSTSVFYKAKNNIKCNEGVSYRGPQCPSWSGHTLVFLGEAFLPHVHKWAQGVWGWGWEAGM